MTRKPRLHRPRLLEMVAVEWVDAQHDTEFDGNPRDYTGTLAKTTDIGFFVSMTREVTVLASCRDADGTTRWLINIPTVNVQSIKPLVTKEAE